MIRRLTAVAATAAAALTALTGCDGTTPTSNRIHGTRLAVYVSVPLRGPTRWSGLATLNGARMALASAHGRVGRYRIVLRALDDATASSRGWNPGQTTVNARAAIKNPATIGYIGDTNSGATAVAIPLLNRAGVPQISPTSTAVGLTQGGLEAAPGEPQKYYPTKARTFARVIPSDRVQVAVQVQLQRAADCDRIVVLDDGEVDGDDTAVSFDYAAKQAGLNVVSTDEYNTKATDYRALAKGVAKKHPNCVMVSALPQNHAVAVTRAIARAVPNAWLFATAGLAGPSFVDPAHGGIPATLDPRMTITAGMLGPREYPPAGRRFLRQYAAHYGPPPPDAIFGYAAMALLLDAVTRATAGGDREATRSRVLRELFATRDLDSVLGRYGIDGNGDTTLRRFGVYHVSGGRLVFVESRRG
ncbi:MAG TPA: branched-chain amino acid ABC transporter substrate-binding protein [Solirubrobacteraceae bacterium]|nr:branched-chain amino acid ABC transporter substrate-binding protein [Solirubrobacteraceae bacterium]